MHPLDPNLYVMHSATTQRPRAASPIPAPCPLPHLQLCFPLTTSQQPSLPPVQQEADLLQLRADLVQRALREGRGAGRGGASRWCRHSGYSVLAQQNCQQVGLSCFHCSMCCSMHRKVDTYFPLSGSTSPPRVPPSPPSRHHPPHLTPANPVPTHLQPLGHVGRQHGLLLHQIHVHRVGGLAEGAR